MTGAALLERERLTGLDFSGFRLRVVGGVENRLEDIARLLRLARL